MSTNNATSSPSSPPSSGECEEWSFNFLDGDFLAALLTAVALVVSVMAYFWQRRQERREEKEADKREEFELDRQQALERVREQLSEYVGPLHRLYKTQNTILQQYRLSTGKDASFMIEALKKKGRAYWIPTFSEESLEPYIEDPTSLEATQYRDMIEWRLKPIYTRIRELVLTHSSNLADLPTQEEWLQKYSKESVMSPYVGSVNVNVIFDTYTTWTYEFDDIIESWKEEDFSRMQPTTKVAWIICNDIVDTLYDEAKAKEARYNKHVKVHKNQLQNGSDPSIMESIFRSKRANGVDKDGVEEVPDSRVATVERVYAQAVMEREKEMP